MTNDTEGNSKIQEKTSLKFRKFNEFRQLIYQTNNFTRNWEKYQKKFGSPYFRGLSQPIATVFTITNLELTSHDFTSFYERNNLNSFSFKTWENFIKRFWLERLLWL